MTDDIQTYLTTQDLAIRYGVTYGTIKRWRREGRGPVYQKLDKLALDPRLPRVRYYLADVLAFEQAKNITPLT